MHVCSALFGRAYRHYTDIGSDLKYVTIYTSCYKCWAACSLHVQLCPVAAQWHAQHSDYSLIEWISCTEFPCQENIFIISTDPWLQWTKVTLHYSHSAGEPIAWLHVSLSSIHGQIWNKLSAHETMTSVFTRKPHFKLKLMKWLWWQQMLLATNVLDICAVHIIVTLQ